ncbi:MAG: hypothetical protein Ta2A_12580 [Treponemataceae bacterium]|nr:MAG: hypothetical protein Ta2A_12580 [Treponemataceae bacterium]
MLRVFATRKLAMLVVVRHPCLTYGLCYAATRAGSVFACRLLRNHSTHAPATTSKHNPPAAHGRVATTSPQNQQALPACAARTPRQNQWQSFRGKRSDAKTRGRMDAPLDFPQKVLYTEKTMNDLLTTHSILTSPPPPPVR